jgi:hypothetical protein
MHRAAALLIATSLAACSSHMYADEARNYTNVAIKLLQEHGHCEGTVDCERKELVKWEAGGYKFGPLQGGGVHINLYQHNDSRVWERLSLEFKALHPKLPKHELTVRAFVGPHASPGTVAHEFVLQ